MTSKDNQTSSIARKAARYAFAISLVGLAAIVFLRLESPYNWLMIEDYKSGTVLWKHEIEAGEWFSHRYIHSVERSPVIEKFQFDDRGRLCTMESWTRSFGAGLPYELQGETERIDGYYVSRELNRLVGSGGIRMLPSSLFPHAFYFREEEILLSEAPYAGNRITIFVKPMTWLESISYSNWKGK
ncbi:DUF1850 domain-containing protein [Paenibacillus sp. 1P07SE]|uniref:DUF1850 domain-containing protein n=1 Tax=Paenibacillus sp. 1P07SE TaxID=3132209 RepID=UPI0039A43B79